MSAIEITAHDVETAIKTGLAQLNLLRAEVRIEVIDDGNRGVLGIGARPARVRLTPYVEIEAEAAAASQAASAPVRPEPTREPTREPTPAPEPPAPEARATPSAVETVEEEAAPVEEYEDEDQEDAADMTPAAEEVEAASSRTITTDTQLAATLTQGVLDRMDFAVTCTSRTVIPQGEDDSPSIWVDIQGKDASRLLAHQCESLDALQTVVQTMWAHQTKSSLRVTLDADSYKERREKRIAQMAQRLAERVISSGRSITLEPMPPSERRLVHIALRDHPRVTTESHGEGSGRRITIKLK